MFEWLSGGRNTGYNNSDIKAIKAMLKPSEVICIHEPENKTDRIIELLEEINSKL